MPKFQTTAAYISGAICGDAWGGFFGGLPINADLRGILGSTTKTICQSARTILREKGGDFCRKQFAADTVIRIERRAVDGAGRYRVHVRERLLSEFPNCAELVNEEAYVGDFMGD